MVGKAFRIDRGQEDIISSLQGFFRLLLEKGGLKGLLISGHLPKGTVAPVLITDPEELKIADPLAPAFPLNAARMVSRLTKKPLMEPIGVVLRSCEMRAFIELVKLKQGSLDNVLLLGFDCLGAFGNREYARLLEESDPFSLTLSFYRNGKREEISSACKACTHPIPETADIAICSIGIDSGFLLEAGTEKGEEVMGKLSLQEAELPEGRKEAIRELLAERSAYRDAIIRETGERTKDLERLSDYFSECVNCYNCRAACPVCYCRECVFLTDLFDHEPSQYLRWAKKKGAIKMPSDTVFFHMTRMAHMSLSCVGCGQCSNACPNGIPVYELFMTIAGHAQGSFSYEPGRGLEEEPPLSTFREREFPEVTGESVRF